MSDSPFKAYDVRGRIAAQLTPAFMQRLGQAYVQVTGAKTVVTGYDARDSSPGLCAALIEGVRRAGCDVLELGLCGTEEIYFATTHLETDGGLMVTASHNPIEYNGIKFVLSESRPLGQADLSAMERLVTSADFMPATRSGGLQKTDPRDAYVSRVLSFVDLTKIGPLRILVNAGNGAAGPTFDVIATQMKAAGCPIEFIKMHHDPDPSFPNGIPNPLLTDNHAEIGAAIRDAGANFGVAWDGDFDRCFFFDADGIFIDGAYVVGLLAAAFLAKNAGETIVYDPRIVLNTRDIVADAGGIAIAARTGHTFMKQALRDHHAIYGGEMSAHHYFRDFMFCDSGMIPWLLVAELVVETGKSLADLVADRVAKYPVSGETNFPVLNADTAIKRVLARYEADAVSRDDTDGVSLSFSNWRFNLRRSNTESLLRLNVEAQGDAALVATHLGDISAIING